ncbi:hypothetical protein N7474_002746 [Penicillium riverlandense]|uniref:uncharacterized protein n=1 Tax=Penicillium riverlandense TaxID=1903569 RepID=UPI0025487262|nr:uncharacterized protein N7474_002746 [Penicillium riverlandense]KAJ5825608.1 hypothetical protein N7474_002746 [Penicillium riverlandense]
MSQVPVFSNEIWLLIMEILDQTSLKALAEVSKDMHALSMPILYSKIDLSIHHTVPQVVLQDQQNVTRWPIDISKIFGQQTLFMQRILDRPELALRVRSFTWTMGLHQLCESPTWAHKSTLIHKLDNIYTLFQSLRHVIRIDISGGEFHDYSPPSPQDIFFPDATHIRLSGQMHYALASAILYGPNKVPLQSLALCNLLERGRLKSGDNFQPQYDPRYKYMPRILPLEEIWPEDGGPPEQIEPGHMTHLLGPALQSRCSSSLRRFTFGVLDLTPEFSHGMLPPGWRVRTSVIHEELTNFFRNVHPQKVEIIYSKLSPERRAELESLYYRPKCVIRQRPPSRSQHVFLQTLFEGWPGLEALMLYGGQLGPASPIRPADPLPSAVGCVNLESVRVSFEPLDWVVYQGQIRTPSQ